MFLMRADRLRGEVVGGLALEISRKSQKTNSPGRLSNDKGAGLIETTFLKNLVTLYTSNELNI